MAFTVTGLVGWAIPDLRIAVSSLRNTPGDGCLAPQDRRLAGPSPDRSRAPPGLCQDDERHPRRFTPRYGSVPAPVPAIAAAACPAPENGGHPDGALARTPVADWAVICVQLDPVRHRPIAWMKLRMIAVP